MNRLLSDTLQESLQHWQKHSQRLGSHWRRLTPREQRVLAFGGTALFALVLWKGFVDPALMRIEHWNSELPRLRSQAAAVEDVLHEVESLRGPLRDTPADAEAIRQSLREQQVESGYTLESPAPQRWTLHVVAASGKALIRWLTRAPAALRLSIGEAHLARLADEPTNLPSERVSALIHMWPRSAPKESP